MVSSPKDIFDRYCKANHMRCTPERYLIIDEIFQLSGHFTIDDLYLRICQRHPGKKVSKGSLYRTIPHLIRAGLLRECFLDHGQSCYEAVLGAHHHEHLKCIECGKIMEFSNQQIDAIERDICKKLRFQLIDHSHVLLGYCADCRRDEE